jgi:lysozyme
MGLHQCGVVRRGIHGLVRSLLDTLPAMAGLGHRGSFGPSGLLSPEQQEMMRLSRAGLDFLKGYEKLRLVAYKPTPDDKWTIGWGHTGPEVVEGLVWTEAQAEFTFWRDVAPAEYGVTKSIDVSLNQNQFDALVCFTFNVGVSAEAHSTLCAKVNTRDSTGIALEWLKWDHQAGAVVPGLLARRKAELAMFGAEAEGRASQSG